MKRISLFAFLLYIALYVPQYVAAQPYPGPARDTFRQEGIGSWYGPGFDGRPTASGEIFDSSQYTAAHPDLPFGTILLVTNRNNNRQVNVRVNDRGPFVASRIIDVSKAAAEYLDMIITGTAPLVIEVVQASQYPAPAYAPTPPAYPPAPQYPAYPPQPQYPPAAQPQPQVIYPPAPQVYPPAQPQSPYPPVAQPQTPYPPAPQYPVYPPQPQYPPAAQPQPQQPVYPPPPPAPPVQQFIEPQVPPQTPVAPPPAPPLQPEPMILSQVTQNPPPNQAQPNPPAPATPPPQATPQPASPALRLIPAMEPQPGKTYKLQIGSYKDPRSAVSTFEKLRDAGLSPSYERYGDYYRVVLAGIRGTEIQSVSSKLSSAGFREAVIREE